jgi:hypothetical protein
MTERRAAFAILLAMLVLTVMGAEPLRARAAWPETAAANSVVFAVRAPLPGHLDYLQAIRSIDDRMKYLDPLSAFFVSPAGELCFRTFPAYVHDIYDSHYSDRCLYPQAVSSIQALTRQIAEPDELILWCGHDFPQCVRGQGYPVFPGLVHSAANSVTVPTAAYLHQRAVLLNLIYLMGGNAVPDTPVPLLVWTPPPMIVEGR